VLLLLPYLEYSADKTLVLCEIKMIDRFFMKKVFTPRNAPPVVWQYVATRWNGTQNFMAWMIDVNNKYDVLSVWLIEGGGKNGDVVLLDMR
jgi:hypothetical protein